MLLVGRAIKSINLNQLLKRVINFSGVWAGSLIAPTKACSDPVWQVLDLLTDERYGLGMPLSKIDLPSLYEASVYNNEKINNGFGGVERRYQCNIQLQSKESAWDVINAFCSACNMKPYYAEGKIFFWQDRPGSVVRQFTQADVEEGRFIYTSTAVKSRYTVGIAVWNDPKDFYRRTVEIYEDVVGIEKYG